MNVGKGVQCLGMPLNGSEQIKDFPPKFNALENEVKKLTQNTAGIKVATWIAAIATLIIAIIAILEFLK